MFNREHLLQSVSTYQDIELETTTNLIEIRLLPQCIRQMKEQHLLEKHFTTLPAGVIAGIPMTEASAPENRVKNRYVQSKPYDYNRVILHEKSTRKQPTYINASHIDGFRKIRKYIASQAPKKETMEDFWHMIWEQQCTCIVMLTNLIENHRPQCEQYWPSDISKSIMCVEFEIRLNSSDYYAYHIVRKLKIVHTTSDSQKNRAITQFHFTAWPDKNIPDHCLPLVLFHRLVNATTAAESDSGPLVIHCSSGAGRTGTFIALDILVEQATTTGVVDVLACVHKLRRQRMDMVQIAIQYEFLHDALLYELMASGRLNCGLYANIDTTDDLEQEFQILNSLRSISSHVSSATSSDNIQQNKNSAIISSDRKCPYLETLNGRSLSKYIKAAFVNSLKRFDAFIVTQTPLPATLEDFWTLVYDYNCSVIVTLDNIDGLAENVSIFWPPNVNTAHGCLKLSCVTDVSTNNNFFSQQYRISKHTNEPARTVRHLYVNVECTSTTEHKVAALSRIVAELECVRVSEEQRILVHCRDGVRLSTLLCALLIAVEQKKEGQVVDLCTAIQLVRLTQPHTVNNLEDYKLLHNLVKASNALSRTYVNINPRT